MFLVATGGSWEFWRCNLFLKILYTYQNWAYLFALLVVLLLSASAAAVWVSDSGLLESGRPPRLVAFQNQRLREFVYIETFRYENLRSKQNKIRIFINLQFCSGCPSSPTLTERKYIRIRLWGRPASGRFWWWNLWRKEFKSQANRLRKPNNAQENQVTLKVSNLKKQFKNYFPRYLASTE